MKKYVITGGPGTGKSSIILLLEQLGYTVIREAAEDYIRLCQAQGEKEPWLREDFQEKIFELQLLREEKLRDDDGIVFIDRGIPDGLAYIELAGKKPSEKMLEKLKENRYEKKVFLIENLGNCEKTSYRRENLDESIKIGNKIEEIYKNLGYEVIKIKSGKLEERVKEILKHIDNRKE